MIISTLDKVVVYVSQTFEGRKHDYAILKEAFPPDLPWFDLTIVLVISGFKALSLIIRVMTFLFLSRNRARARKILIPS